MHQLTQQLKSGKMEILEKGISFAHKRYEIFVNINFYIKL